MAAVTSDCRLVACSPAGVRVSTHELGGGTNIQTIELIGFEVKMQPDRP